MKAFVIAFSMYSRLPMPHMEWDEKGMRHALCFFPLVGAVIGAVFLLWHMFCGWLSIGGFLRTAGLCVIPLLITGGIHMDGFLDTFDALASHQPKEKKLEILKDSHIGAFAVIACGMYLLLQAGAYDGLTSVRAVLAVASGFVLSRSVCVLVMLRIPSARHSGLLYSFSSTADRRTVMGCAALESLAVFGVMVWIDPVLAAAAGLSCLVLLLWYRRMALHGFGGITGDLAGCFVELCELCVALAVCIAARLPL